MTGCPVKDPCVSFYWMLKNAAEPPIGMPSRFSLVFILLSKPLICFLWQKNRLESPIMGMLSLHSFNRACYCLFSSICLLFISLVPPSTNYSRPDAYLKEDWTKLVREQLFPISLVYIT